MGKLEVVDGNIKIYIERDGSLWLLVLVLIQNIYAATILAISFSIKITTLSLKILSLQRLSLPKCHLIIEKTFSLQSFCWYIFHCILIKDILGLLCLIIRVRKNLFLNIFLINIIFLRVMLGIQLILQPNVYKLTWHLMWR